jgi:hypothetical protein
MKKIMLTISSILLAGSLFGKKPALHPPDAQVGWHVVVFDTLLAKSPNLYAVGDDICHADDFSVHCGVRLSHPKFLLSNGHIIENLGEFDMYLHITGYTLGGHYLTHYDTYEFSYHLEPFATQDILGRPVTKQHLTVYLPRLNPPPKYLWSTVLGIDSMFKGGVVMTIDDWHQASHDITMSNVAAEILRCDEHHQKTGLACTDETVVKILRQFMSQTPALSLVDPAFAKRDEYLSQFIH